MDTHLVPRIIIVLLGLASIVMTGCREEPTAPDEPDQPDTSGTPADTSIHGYPSHPPAPAIASFFPESVPAGRKVTIRGIGFGTGGTGLVVRFGTLSAEIVSATDTAIDVRVPARAPFAPITVTRGPLTLTSAKNFLPVPTFRVMLHIEGITGVWARSTYMEANLSETDTSEQELMRDIGAVVQHTSYGPGGTDTLRSPENYAPRALILLDTINRRIISADWWYGSWGTNENGPGHSDDESYGSSWRLTLYDLPYTVTPDGITCRVDAAAITRSMIGYGESSYRSGIMIADSDIRTTLTGLGVPVAGGYVSLTIEGQ